MYIHTVVRRAIVATLKENPNRMKGMNFKTIHTKGKIVLTEEELVRARKYQKRINKQKRDRIINAQQYK